MRDTKPQIYLGKLFLTSIQILLCAVSFGQSSLVISPAANNDTVLLCHPANNVAAFSVSNGSGSYSWTFSGGSPATASGTGSHSITYSSAGTYTATINSPSDPNLDGRQITVIVGNPTAVALSPSDTLFCDSDAPYIIDGAFPGGGYFSGPGINGNTFDPTAAGIGTHTITYYYQNGSCLDSATQDFVVMVTPNTNLAAQGSPIVFDGKLTYSRCVPANSTFNFYTTTNSSTYTSYSIDFGDGSAVQTGTTFPSPAMAHAFPNIGQYKVVLTLLGANGCPSHDTVLVFYGSNPSVGLSTQGNNIKCLPRDSTGITFWFPVTSYQSNPPGTIYVVEVNDGSPPQYYNHPPPDSIGHTFFEPSCGYQSVSFNDAFMVKITAQTPCQPHSAATVEPIYISDPPTAAFEAPERICIGNTAFINDASWGSQNALTGCDTNVLLVWEISPSTFTLQNGNLGATFNDPYPGNWIGGSEQLEVLFQRKGYYTVKQYVGNQAGCEVDTMEMVICVDSIPDPDFELIVDTLCVPDTVKGHYLNHLISLCDTSDLQWDISPATGHTLLSSPTDSIFEAYFYEAGNYTITVTANNMCGSASFSRIINVGNAPSLVMEPDQDFCGLQTIDISNPLFAPTKYDSLAPLLSHQWDIYPNTGWTFINGTNASSEFPEIDFTAYGTYQLVYTITNRCGTDTDTMELSFWEIPTLDPIPDTLICYNSDFGVRATAQGGNTPYSWQWFTSGSAGVQGTSDSLFLAGITTNTTVSVTVTDSAGCSDTTDFEITVTPPLTVNAGPDQTICYTDTAFLSATPTGGTAPYTYAWSPNIGLNDSTLQSPFRTPLDSTVAYTITITDAKGCTATDQVIINVTPLINLDAGPDFTLCHDSILYPLTSQSHNGGVWSGPGVSAGNFDPIVAGLGTHKLYYNYIDAGGCAYLDSLEITVISIPEANFSLSQFAGCSILETQVYDSSTVGVSHFWYVDGVLTSNQAAPLFSLVNNSNTTDRIVTIKLIITAGTGCKDSIQKTVTVYPNPQAVINTPASICANDSVQISSGSVFKGTAKYEWYAPGNVSISNDTIAAPYFGFPDNQSGIDSVYTIGLIVTSVDGCTDTIQQNIIIYSRPVADFGLPANACAPIGINPINTSIGSGLNYNWTVSPSVTITGASSANPTFNFPAVATDSAVYTIALYISDDNGCIDTASKTYTVYPIPTADYTTSVNDSCGPMVVNFHNWSTSNISNQFLKDLTIDWDFGNGQTSNDSLPVVTFLNNGVNDTNYVVTLTVTNQFGCTDVLIDTITVHPDPFAGISAKYWAGCAPFSIDTSAVTAVSSPNANLNYIWIVTDMSGNLLKTDTGLYSLSYILATDGDSVNLRLITTSPYGCLNDTLDAMFYTIENPEANFAILPDSGCSPLTITMSDSSTTGVLHDWFINGNLFSQAISPSLTLVNNSHTKDSIAEIKLVIMSGTGCIDSAIQYVTIHPRPLADFSIAANSCPADTLTATNNTIGKGALSYSWSVNSPAVWVSNPSDSTPSFGFPDNQSGTDSVYTITLISTSEDGCTDTTTQNVTIFARPVANFNLPAAACAPFTLNPTDSSTGNNISYSWSISPSVPGSNLATASPSFNLPITTNDSVQYAISLSLTDVNGCTDTISHKYTVHPVPTSGFTMSVADTCGPHAIKFTNTSTPNQTGMDRSSMNFYWNFGNGQGSTDSIPSTTYFNNGTKDTTYYISLYVVNAFGCDDLYEDSITIHPDPVADINFNSTVSCAPFVIDSSVVNAVSYSSANSQYNWRVLDTKGNVISTFSGINAVNHTITAAADTVILELTAVSPFGCSTDTATKLFYTIENPVARFTPVPAQACSPATVTVLDSSSVGANKSWYVNGQFFASGNNPVFNFVNNSITQDSIITIKVVVEAGTGCKDSVEHQVTIYPKPIADFSIAANSCPGDTLVATNASTGKAPLSYSWNISSSAVWVLDTAALDPSFGFPDNQSGFDSTYTITLITYTADGCSDTITNDVTIFARPVADFSLPANACSPEILTPTDLSSGNNINYNWTITPSVMATGLNTSTPQFDLPLSTNDSVQYTIHLALTDTNGCVDSITKYYTVYPKPTAGFTLSTADTCSPYNANFSNTSLTNQSGMGPGTMTFTWDLGNGQTSTDSIPATAYTNTGNTDTTYYITLTVTNAFGCSDTISDSITIHPDPVADINFSSAVACAPFVIDSTIVNAISYSSANSQYNWRILDTQGNVISNFSGLNNVSHIITAPADTVILELTAVSPFGCKTDTATQVFYTIDNPVAKFTPVPAQACSPVTVSVLDSSSTGANKSWYVNGQFFASGNNPVFNFVNNSITQDSIITIKVVVEAGTGCKDSVEHQVTIYPKPIADFSIAANSCPGDTLVATNASIGKAPLSYSWAISSSAVWISDTAALNPSFGFPDNQSGFDSTYTITLITYTADGCSDTITNDVIIFARPVADFSLPTNACSPEILNPTDLSSGNNINYNWTITPSVIATGLNTSTPQFDLPLSTNDSVQYTIHLALTDTNGCVDSITKYYTVYPKPMAGFTPSNNDSCGPFTVSFANTSSPNQAGMTRADMNFFWDFGNGQTSTDSVPTVVYNNIGLQDSTYFVQLIATNAWGCSDTISDSITVHPDPIVSYTLTTASDCAPFEIDTTVISHTHHGVANSGYTWDFVDVNTGLVVQSFSNSDSINYTLALPGDSIILRTVAYSPYGCKIDTVETLLFALGNSLPGFVASAYDGCSPLTVNFTDTVPGFNTWSWLVDGQMVSNIQNPTYTFTNTSTTADSTYKVQMIATTGLGCTDTVTQYITVFAQMVPGFDVAPNCKGDTTYFTNTTQSIDTIISWSWDFGDGQTDSTESPSHRYANPGVYIINMSATNVHGCVAGQIDTVTIYPRPVANFVANSACGNDTLCKDQSFTLQDSSTIATLGGSITAWSWDIDADGTIEYTTQNPLHTFTSIGNYQIRLIVTSQYGCTDTILRTVEVNEIPVAYFTIDSATGCGPVTTTVTDSSFGNIDTHYWEVYTKNPSGAKTTIFTSYQANPGTLPTFLPKFTADTTYYISYTVSNCCGSYTHTDSLVLTSIPIASMIPSVTQGCNPLTVNFQLDGPVSGQPEYLVMDYGDGNVDTLYQFYQINTVGDTVWVWGQPTHIFHNPNVQDTTYTVKLTTVNKCGDSTVTADILVYPTNAQAFINASPAQGCAPLTVTLKDASYGGINTSWCLDYDTATGTCNQPTALGDSIVYTYNTPGTYVVAQFVDDGCSLDTAFKVITVYPSPTAAFTHTTPACEDGTVSFTDQSTTNSSGISGYVWDFGDGHTSFLQNPVHQYTSSGTFTACMVVMTAGGCMDSVCKTVTIYAKPEVKFSGTNECLNEQPIAFFDSSSVAHGQIISTLWKFGDGNTSVSANPVHTYANPGMYTVTLIHGSSYGCIDSSTQVVNVFPTATADFEPGRSFGKACGAPQSYGFTNLSTNAAGYYWDFDYNGNRGQNTSTLTNPGFIFQQEGVYTVMLIATNTNGCSDTMTKDVIIRPFPKAGFRGNNFEGCAPLTVDFTDTTVYNFAQGGIVDWVWDFGDGTTASGTPNVTHTYTVPGNYAVSLLVENDGGCIDTILLNNYIDVLATPYAGFDAQKIDAKTYKFNNLTRFINGSTTFEWDFGDGNTSTEFEPEHRYNVNLLGNDYEFEVCLKTANAEGCGDTICTPIKLTGYDLFTPNAFAPDLAGAGAAQYFLPAGHSMKTYHLYIFDEWGNIIFESTSLDESGIPNEPWDGKHMETGTELPLGAYVWKIDAVFTDGTIWEGHSYGKKRKNYGTVTLIR
ncbi:PKD domain-containing protein [Owenweeksia hongkongensis]|uniref:PKD domain-containing protein n=1 Tax=Owenweeksia hongkongensis TaxID=253245 RepID=UPI003A9317B1